MSRFAFLTIVLGACLLHPAAALAWGYQGHKVVGAIALQVKNILNGPKPPANPNAPKKLATPAPLTPKQAGPWADCVKSVVLFATNGKSLLGGPERGSMHQLQFGRGAGAYGGPRPPQLG